MHKTLHFLSGVILRGNDKVSHEMQTVTVHGSAAPAGTSEAHSCNPRTARASLHSDALLLSLGHEGKHG